MKIPFDYNKYKNYYTADFETSTDAWNVSEARVWLWDICTKNYNHFNGNDIDSFMDFISRYDKCVFIFHNLGYDGMYILYWLLNKGYRFNQLGELSTMEFTTIISPQISHYVYVIRFTNGNIVTISDSFKHNSQSVEKLAKTYNLPISKLKIDYNEVRDTGHIPTNEELEYIHCDTEICMRVLNEDFSHKFTKFTESGNSLKFFKKSIGCDYYDCVFPQLTDTEDKFVRKSYRGGYCWLKPDHFNKILSGMISIDINSMYPAQMLHELLPYGDGIYVKGDCTTSKYYNENNTVFIQHLKAQFICKKDRPPTIAKKSIGRLSINELYLYSSGGYVCDLYLTSVDLQLFFECYEIIEIEFIDGIIYKAKKGYEVNENEAKNLTVDEIIKLDGKGSFYYDYIYEWRMQKEHETGSKRDRAKKMQNIAYGCQATSKNGELAEPYLDGKGIIHFKRYIGKERKGGYIPLATFITAHSRKLLIDRFVYCDTDSCYLLGTEIPDTKIHDTLYGYFKVEHIIEKAKYLGPKRYCYKTTENSPKDPNKFIVVCCGAPPSVTEQMNFDNFVPYNKDTGEGEFYGKIKATIVVGGKHLTETTYRLVV